MCNDAVMSVQHCFLQVLSLNLTNFLPSLLSFVRYGGLKKNAHKGSDTIRKYGLVEVGVALVGEVCHCGVWALSSPIFKTFSVSQSTSCSLMIKM